MACGLLERQFQRVQPRRELVDWSVPLEIACEPSGTSTETSYVALSSGWSLLGNHHQAASGSLAPTPPSGVRCQLVKPYACFDEGTPLYRTTTVTAVPLARGVRG